MDDLLYQRLGIAVNYLAQDFLTRKIGDRIPPISRYQEQLGVSRGTVQNSLNYLKERGAIALVSRGHLGTFIENLDYHCLQECSFRKELMGAMPLPYSLSYQGLATALYRSFPSISFNLVYARGAESRLHLVTTGACQFIVCSRYTAEKAIAENQPVEVLTDLGAGSYLSRHVLVMRQPGIQSIQSGMRVAYDRSSLDQKALTEMVCKGVPDVRFVELHAYQTVAAIRAGQIDAGVWNLDEIVESESSDLNLVSLDGIMDVTAFSSAVIVVQKNDAATSRLLSHCLNAEHIRKIQNGVKQGAIHPDY